MKQYTVRVPVKSVVGHQYYTVDAESESEAIEKAKNGEGEFAYEELEVQDHRWDEADTTE